MITFSGFTQVAFLVQILEGIINALEKCGSFLCWLIFFPFYFVYVCLFFQVSWGIITYKIVIYLNCTLRWFDVYCERILPPFLQLIIHLSLDKFFVCMYDNIWSTLWPNLLYETELLIIVTMFYIRFSELFYIIGENLCLGTKLTLFFLPLCSWKPFLYSVSMIILFCFRFHI